MRRGTHVSGSGTVPDRKKETVTGYSVTFKTMIVRSSLKGAPLQKS
jgi:hypothetical protein